MCWLIKNNGYFDNSNICKSSKDIPVCFYHLNFNNYLFFIHNLPLKTLGLFLSKFVKFLLIKCEWAIELACLIKK